MRKGASSEGSLERLLLLATRPLSANVKRSRAALAPQEGAQ